MLHSRRNHGTKELLQDATRASSRVAEQAQQTLSGIAGDSRGLAQTARTELGDLSREVRDQASGKVTRARRRTARKLARAADAVEPSPGKKRRGRPVLKAALAATAGWVLVNVARKARQKADESSESTESTSESETVTGPDGAGASEPAEAAATASTASDEAEAKAEPDRVSATKANSSSD